MMLRSTKPLVGLLRCNTPKQFRLPEIFNFVDYKKPRRHTVVRVRLDKGQEGSWRHRTEGLVMTFIRNLYHDISHKADVGVEYHESFRGNGSRPSDSPKITESL